jgi:hypothetical protein
MRKLHIFFEYSNNGMKYLFYFAPSYSTPLYSAPFGLMKWNGAERNRSKIPGI